MEHKEMQHWQSAIQQILLEKPEHNQETKLPLGLKNKDPKELAWILTQAYRAVVEKRGMEFKDIPEAQIGDIIEDVVTWMREPKYRSTLFLQGTVGSGKTSIMRALGIVYSAVGAGYQFCQAIDICEQYRFLRNGDSNYYAYYKEKEKLLVDDLGAEPFRFLHYGVDYTPVQDLLDYRYRKQLTTIITTNLTEEQLIERYGERCWDRFNEMCTVVLFPGPSFRELLVEDHSE